MFTVLAFNIKIFDTFSICVSLPLSMKEAGRVSGSNNLVFGFDMMYCVARHFCLGFVFVACVAAGPRTRLNHLYSLSAN